MNRCTTNLGRRDWVRCGATRCWLLCYVALALVGYLVFVRSAPSIPIVHAQDQGQQPTIRLREPRDGRPARFEVHGLPTAVLDRLASDEALRQALFTVGVATQDDAPSPMLGSYRVADGLLLFEPRFSLSPGVTYLAWLRSSDTLPNSITRRFSIPRPRPASPTVVESVFPTSSELPENQLKFYVFFSAPMSRGHAYRNIRLLKEDGQVVEGAFLEIAEELWDRTLTRFTLLLDPGRVKRGLKPREEDGPVLEEGHRYTLAIDQAWPDAAGFELKEAVRKSFTVLAPDDTPPDTATWKLDPPSRDNDHTLTVEFPEPLDRALLERVLWVETSDGQRVEGRIHIDRRETRWRFQPAEPWDNEQSYALAAERILEDRAGNRIGRKFEVNVFEKIDRRIESEVVRLPFRVMP